MTTMQAKTKRREKIAGDMSELVPSLSKRQLVLVVQSMLECWVSPNAADRVYEYDELVEDLIERL